ncbi:MAG: hypothetical protein KGZ58_12785 [Ignavibacteriales bacterium]|nr:hypothetical protein [Ignavibacteriales bacterium]
MKSAAKASMKARKQLLKIKLDLTEAFIEVKKMREGKIRKQTLSEFLDVHNIN